MKPTPTYANKPTSDNPRDVEAWALAEAARRLIDAARQRSDEEFVAALQLNQRLWTIFQAAMTEEDCGHPQDVRTNIAALSLLVDRETTARMVDMDFDKVETLVNINRNVAAGLTAQAQAMAAAQAQQAAAAQAGAPQAPAASPAAPQAAMAPRPAAPMPPRPPMAPAADSSAVPREPLRISI